MSDRPLRWRGAVAATALLAAVGLLERNAVLVLAATIPLAAVAVAAVATVRPPEGVRAVRTVDPSPVPPGQAVSVSLEVTNEGDRTLPDVRIVDGVPDEIAVLEGSPRAGTTLAPGESTTLEYVVVARRGEYDFDPPELRLRDATASARATGPAETDGDDALACRIDADAPPLEAAGSDRVGQLPVDEAGRGVSFHSIREFHPEDPADRIDWRHYAKRNELATIEYERPVAATVVLVVDARAPNRVVAGPGRPTAVELGAYAATRALTDLLGRGHRVGVAIVGLDGPGPAGLHWLAPARGKSQRSRALELFRLAADPPNDGGRRALDDQVRKVIELAAAGTQVALFAPLLDGAPVEAVETWRAATLPVVVLSPDVVPENAVSGQYEAVRRRTRLTRCQATGARTIDWRRGTPLPVVLEQAFAADARLSADRLAGAANGGGD